MARPWIFTLDASCLWAIIVCLVFWGLVIWALVSWL